MEQEFLYRLETFIDGYSIYLCLKKYLITKKTKCGYWITDLCFKNNKKLVITKYENGNKPIKAFARETKIEALNDLYIRSQININYLERNLINAKLKLENLNKVINKLNIQMVNSQRPSRIEDLKELNREIDEKITKKLDTTLNKEYIEICSSYYKDFNIYNIIKRG